MKTVIEVFNIIICMPVLINLDEKKTNSSILKMNFTSKISSEPLRKITFYVIHVIYEIRIIRQIELFNLSWNACEYYIYILHN